ncbi:MAG: hypothetical protein HGB19_00210 [Chlorobiales bacterium]|jgi:hypothetical protein|nr:hypothetical protein [Chlorobiales bacterium]
MNRRILSFFIVILCAISLQSKSYAHLSENASGTCRYDGSTDETGDLYGNPFNPMGGIAGSIGLNNAGFTATIEYVRLFTPDRIGFLSLSVTATNDGKERETFDPYTGERTSMNKVNSMLVLPLTVGLRQRFFSDEIESTFRPFVEVGVGPSFGYVTNYDDGFFGGFSKGRAAWGLNGVVGVGAYFGSSPTAIQGFALRYQFHYFIESVELVEQNPRNYFDTISINLIFGTFFK